MVDYRDFGAQVRRIRRELGLTQEELAERVGISTSFMGHIERGNRIASLETLVALCNVLEVSPRLLLQASLKGEFDDQLPEGMSNEERGRLSSFLRIANEVVNRRYE